MSTNAEIRIIAGSVSRGIAIGKAVCLYGRRRQFFRTELAADQVDRELRRFRAAIRLAVRQLGRLGSNGIGDNATGILDFHRMILSDPSLLISIEQKVVDERINAEWAVKIVTDSYLAKYKTIPDEKLRERFIDLEDVTERIMTALGGGRRRHGLLDKNSIIVSREMNPSTLIELSENDPAGIITEHGGWASHTFILAREMGIPAVTGVRRALGRIRTGDTVLLDGYRGEVTVRPSSTLVDEYKKRSFAPSLRVVATSAGADLKTLDGRKIVIRANADIAGGYEKARAEGALGVGLFRSEFIFNQFRGIPTESEQVEAYRKIALLAGEHGVRIRTFDYGIDDIADPATTKSKNPALGLRAIRLSFEREKQFRVQLRALLQAAHNTRIDVILPMVSDISEILRAKELLAEESAALKAKRIEIGSPRFGVMIEVPSSVLLVNEILDEVDVLCLGTNDLVQYILAVDRDNEAVAKWFNTLNPAIVKAIKTVVDAAESRKTSCVVCGEMAGSPFYVPVLIGLGATELSMNANSISKVRRVVAGIAYEETLSLVRRIQACRTAAKADETVRDCIREHWSHLYPDGN